MASHLQWYGTGSGHNQKEPQHALASASDTRRRIVCRSVLVEITTNNGVIDLSSVARRAGKVGGIGVFTPCLRGKCTKHFLHKDWAC